MRTAPFKPGSLKIHFAQDEPVPGFQAIAGPQAGETIYINPVPELTEEHLRRIMVGRGRLGDATILMQFTGDGSERLARVTSANIGKRMAFIIQGRVVTAPRIMSAITGGEAVVQGSFTEDEAKQLVMTLSGS